MHHNAGEKYIAPAKALLPFLLLELKNKLNTTIIDFNLQYVALMQYSYTQTK